MRRSGRTGLHLQRHVLVLGCRGGGVCLLQFPNGLDVLADSEVGRRV